MEPNQIRSYILKNLYTGLIKTSSAFILSIVAIPLTIKNIGIEKYGLISVVLMFSSFTGIFDLGFSKALIYLNGERRANENEISAVYFLNRLMFIVIVLSGLTFYIFRINLLGKNIETDINIIRIINLISLLILGLEVINNLLRSSLEAEFKLNKVNEGFMIQSAVIYLGWFLLSIFNADIILFLITPLVSSLFSITFYKYHLSLTPSLLQIPHFSSIKKVISVSFSFFKVGALNSLHLPMIKYVLVLVSGDPKSIGIFDLSAKLAGIPVSVMAYVSGPFFSLVSKFKDTDRKYIWRLVRKSSFLLILVAILGYLSFLLLNKYLIYYFFKENSKLIFDILNMLLIGYLSIAITESVQRYHLGIGKINVVSGVKLICILSNIFLISLLLFKDRFNLLNLTMTYCISLSLSGTFWLVMLFSTKEMTIK